MSTSEETSFDRAFYLVNQIVLEKRIDSRAAMYLDSLLSWLGGRSSDVTEQIKNQFQSQSIDADKAKDLSLSVLDDFLFSNQESPLRTLGFVAHPGRDTLKLRYRRLMQVYHPDRGLAGEKWSNDRAELINAAYLEAGNYVAEKATRNGKPVVDSKESNIQTDLSRPGVVRTHDKFRIRRSLGSASKFRRTVLIVLFSISSFLLTLIYISSYDGKLQSDRWEDRVGEQADDFEADIYNQHANFDPGDSSDNTEESVQSLPDGSDSISGSIDEFAEYEKFGSFAYEVFSTPPYGSLRGVERAGLGNKNGNQRDAQRTKVIGKRPADSDLTSERQLLKSDDQYNNSLVKSSLVTKKQNKSEGADDQIGVSKTIVQKSDITKINSIEKDALIVSPDNVESQKLSAASALDEKNLKSDDLSSEVKSEEQTKVTKQSDTKQNGLTKKLSRDQILAMKDSAMKSLVTYVDGILSGNTKMVQDALASEIVIGGVSRTRNQTVSSLQSMFDNTSERKYIFRVTSWEQRTSQLMVANGSARIRYKFRNSSDEYYSGKLTFFVKISDGDARIFRIDQE